MAWFNADSVCLLSETERKSFLKRFKYSTSENIQDNWGQQCQHQYENLDLMLTIN